MSEPTVTYEPPEGWRCSCANSAEFEVCGHVVDAAARQRLQQKMKPSGPSGEIPAPDAEGLH